MVKLRNTSKILFLKLGPNRKYVCFSKSFHSWLRGWKLRCRNSQVEGWDAHGCLALFNKNDNLCYFYSLVLSVIILTLGNRNKIDREIHL